MALSVGLSVQMRESMLRQTVHLRVAIKTQKILIGLKDVLHLDIT